MRQTFAEAVAEPRFLFCTPEHARGNEQVGTFMWGCKPLSAGDSFREQGGIVTGILAAFPIVQSFQETPISKKKRKENETLISKKINETHISEKTHVSKKEKETSQKDRSSHLKKNTSSLPSQSYYSLMHWPSVCRR